MSKLAMTGGQELVQTLRPSSWCLCSGPIQMLEGLQSSDAATRRIGVAPVFFAALLALGLALVSAAAAPTWEAGAGFRRAPLALMAAGKTGFTRLDAATTGITFSNLLTKEKSLTNQVFLNGSG